jgi:large subunit ribosomal protein L3
MKFILAKKLGMTTIYEADGTAQNSTILEAGKNFITQVRTEEKDGYEAIQWGVKKEKGDEFELIREVKVDKDDIATMKIGDELKVDQFEVKEKVTIIGITKGKGNQGVVKRHGFAGSPASHGHRHDLRAPGSIGSAFPERVFKGKKMAGRMGSDQHTTKNLKIVQIDGEKGIIAIKGAIPGKNGSLIRVISQ